jgi:alanine racemase
VERTFVEISRQKLIENYQAIQRLVGTSVEILAVVKADAYGHGAVEVARALERAGARWFAVTSLPEAIELRRGGILGRVIVLADLARSDQDAFEEFGLTRMLHSMDQLHDLEAWLQKQEGNLRSAATAGPDAFAPAGRSPQNGRRSLHLKLDSGMGRLGFHEACLDEIACLLARRPDLHLEGLATHFASAEELTSGQTEEQIGRFQQFVSALAARGIRPSFTHMANSAALVYWPETRASMVRPGLALYGYIMPARGGKAPAPPPLQPVLTWKAQVISVSDFPAGAPLGYNATYRTERPMRIGAVAAGYADGLDRRLSNGGPVLAAGRRVRIVGLVSMDVCLVDLTSTPNVRAGDYITILGRDGSESLDAMQMAAYCGTIPYEVLCGIGKRVPRLYVE